VVGIRVLTYFRLCEIGHQTVLFIESTTRIPKSGDAHLTVLCQKSTNDWLGILKKIIICVLWEQNTKVDDK
jgi:hypothetical protein